MVENRDMRGRRRDPSRAATGRVRDAFRLRPVSGEFGIGVVALIAAGVAGLLVPGIADFYWYYLVGSTVVAGVALWFVSRSRKRSQRSATGRADRPT